MRFKSLLGFNALSFGVLRPDFAISIEFHKSPTGSVSQISVYQGDVVK